MIRFFMRVCLFVITVGLTHPIQAQTFSVSSVDAVAVGNVAAGAIGETVLRLDPATGVVSRITGSGDRLSTVSARSLVTIACRTGTNCNSSRALVTISTVGTPTGRALALRNFTVSTAGASASLATLPGTGSSISFNLSPIGLNQSKTFWVGFDLPIRGDDSGIQTNSASSGFAVTVSRLNGTGVDSKSQTVSANVIRSLAIAKSSDLVFGRIIVPSSGIGTVSLDPVTGLVTATGTGVAVLGTPASAAAQFTVSGEGGQGISVTIPPSFILSGPGGTIAVATSANATGAQVLSGTLGGAGALALRVGGSYTINAATPRGAYSGTLTVTVQYN